MVCDVCSGLLRVSGRTGPFGASLSQLVLLISGRGDGGLDKLNNV